MQPADFYTGIVAELYDPLKSARPDPAEYARLVAKYGEPALELGCGDGDPLLELRRRGLDVDGVDSSSDMLDRCRSRAAAVGLQVVLHHQRMEHLDLVRRYRLIFLAGPTFTLLTDDETALRALTRIRAHLLPGGAAFVPLFIPEPTPADEVGSARKAHTDDGALLSVCVVSEDRDAAARTQTSTLRYERRTQGAQSVVERPWTLHWHTPEGFHALASEAGLSATLTDQETGNAATAHSTDFTAVLHPLWS